MTVFWTLTEGYNQRFKGDWDLIRGQMVTGGQLKECWWWLNHRGQFWRSIRTWSYQSLQVQYWPITARPMSDHSYYSKFLGENYISPSSSPLPRRPAVIWLMAVSRLNTSASANSRWFRPIPVCIVLSLPPLYITSREMTYAKVQRVSPLFTAHWDTFCAWDCCHWCQFGMWQCITALLLPNFDDL